MCTRPSTPGRISTNAPKVTTFVTLPSTTSPSLCCSSTCCQGSDCVCFRPSEMRCRSRSMSSTFTLTVWPISSTSEGWLTCDHDSSEMWIRPSIPSRSTNAEVEDQSALDHLDHPAVDRLAGFGGALDRLPRQLEARTLLRQDEAALRILLRHHERVDLVPDGDLVGRVDRTPDRELGDRDHAFRLVTDVDEHLVLVHPDDGAVDDLPFVDRREGRLVVGDQLAVGTRGPDAVACDRLFSLGGHIAADQYS